MSDKKLEDLEIRKLELEVEKLDRESRLVKGDPHARGEFTYVGPVTESRVHNLIDRLAIWSNNHPGAPITLTINSQGGVVIDGYALYDFLQQLKAKGHHITTVGVGLVASMGGILLQAGDKRVMTPRCWMLVHEVQGLAEGSYSEMQNVMQFNKRLQDQALDILAERSNWARATIKKKWKQDLWLSAEDALKAGFIDEVSE